MTLFEGGKVYDLQGVLEVCADNFAAGEHYKQISGNDYYPWVVMPRPDWAWMESKSDPSKET